MGPGCELPYRVGDLDGKAVVEIPGKHEDRLAERVPEFDHLLPLAGNRCPCLVLVGAAGSRSDMRNHEVDRGNNEEEVSVALTHFLDEPPFLLLAEQGHAFLPGVVPVVQLAMRPGVEHEEVRIADAYAVVGQPPYRVADLPARRGRRTDSQALRIDDLLDCVDARTGLSALAVQVIDVVTQVVVDTCGRLSPVHVQVGGLR